MGKYKKKKRSRRPVWPWIAVLLLAVAAACALFLPFGLLSSPVSRGGAVMTVNGQEVSAEEFVRALMPEIEKLEADNPDYFADPANEKALLEGAKEQFVSKYALYGWALGLGLDDSLDAETDAYINEVKASFVTEQAFLDALSGEYLTEELYRGEVSKQLLLSRLQRYIYDESELSRVSEADYAAYIEERGILGYRLIFIADADGESAKKQKLAEEIAAAVAEDSSRFDEKQSLYNEDPLAQFYASGYSRAASELTPAVATAVKALDIGQTKGPVAVSDGWCIVMRTQPDASLFYYDIVGERVKAKAAEYELAASVEPARGFKNITVEQIKAAALGQPPPSPLAELISKLTGML